MRVKHKDSEKGVGVTSMALCHWHEHYLPNNKYLNYEFYDVPDIFDLFEINKETGIADIYVRTDFKGTLAHLVRENPLKYVLKEVEPNRLDEYLMPLNSKTHSFLSRLKAPSKIKRKATPKKKEETSKLSKILSTFSNNKLLVGIIIAITVALLNTNRIKNWINSIVDNF